MTTNPPAPRPTPITEDLWKQRDGEGAFDHEKRKLAGVEALERQLAEAREENTTMRETIEWIAGQSDLFFAECSQAEEIVRRCRATLNLPQPADHEQ